MRSILAAVALAAVVPITTQAQPVGPAERRVAAPTAERRFPMRSAERRNRPALTARPTLSAMRILLPDGSTARGVKVGMRLRFR